MRTALLEIAVLAVGALLAFSVVASANDIPEEYRTSVQGAVADCGAKYGWAMATTKEKYNPVQAVHGCIRQLGAYQTWLIKERKAGMNEASRIAVSCLVGGYYGAYRAVVVSRAKDRKEGKYKL